MVRRVVVGFVMGALLSGAPSVAETQAPAAEPARMVAGVVVESDTGTPIAGASVSVGDARTTTDGSGRFELRVPAGLLAVRVSALAHFPLNTTLDVRTANAMGAELALARDTGFATSIEVVAASPASAPATVTVQPLQVLRTPGALDNVFRTLQTMPGVAATEEFSSRLAVRGGAPDQNLTVMDGVEVHDPYRLFGLTSAFNPEIIRRFELATGGFGVTHGDRLSSLLTVENREGVRDRRFAGSGALSITDGNVVLEGALPGGAAGSWLVTGRRTYYDVVASKVTGEDFPGFADLQAKGVWEPRPGRKLTLFALRSRETAAFTIDGTSAQGEFQDDTRNDLFSTSFDVSIGTRGRLHTIAAYSDTTSVFGVDAAVQNTSQRSNAPSEDAFGVANVVFERALTVQDLSLRQELAWAIGSQVFEIGGEAHRLGTSLRYDITGDRNPAAVNGSSVQGGAGLPDVLRSLRRSTRGGAWLQDTRQFGARGSVQAGLRLDYAGVTGETLLSPRVSGQLNLSGTTRLKSALGRYTQSPGYEKLAQSDYVLDFTNAAVRDLRSERAVQASVGLEHDVARGVLLRAEGYYKRFSDMLAGRLETDAERAARVGRYDFPAALASSVPADPIITTVPTNDGAGDAYGFDLFLSRTSAPASARLTGWASYTWGRAERDAYGYQYPFEYDRRHAFTMVSAYRLTSRWELSATTRVASGFPRNAPVGLRVAGVEDKGDRDRDRITDEILPSQDATGLPVYAVDFGSVATLNRARLPLFARVDVRATWRPRGVSGRWEIYIEAINALNRENAGAIEPKLEYDPASDRPRIVETRGQSVPLLPTVGLRFRF
ncbi:MAG: hypothetical protein EXQ59_00485 [Acidobacteria bacterium]|nr:hypothetical protein [Acidobacteriota bacterium]